MKHGFRPRLTSPPEVARDLYARLAESRRTTVHCLWTPAGYLVSAECYEALKREGPVALGVAVLPLDGVSIEVSPLLPWTRTVPTRREQRRRAWRDARQMRADHEGEAAYQEHQWT